MNGERVLVTRAAEDQAALSALLAARGATPVSLPCIAFAPPSDRGPLDEAVRALGRGERPDLVVIASPHAARRFADELRGVDARGLRFAAVGPATAAALAAFGFEVALVPESGAGAQSLAAGLAPLARGRSVLLPRAEEGNPELPSLIGELGGRVQAVPLYRTVPAAAADPAAAALLRAGGIDAIAFASGSAARGFVGLFGAGAPALAAPAAVVCMGRWCAQAASAAGLRVDGAADGGLPELVEKIAELVRARRGR